ncbi:MAG: DUF2577 family protein [Oscillospiraceae bacterium]
MLIDILKEVIVNCVDDVLDINIFYGNITSLLPLEVEIGQNIILKKENLIVIKNSLKGLSEKDTVLILSLKQSFYLLGGVDY